MEDVTRALVWAANHEDWMDELIRKRVQVMEQRAERYYPDFVSGLEDVDAVEYRRQAR